MIPITPEAVAKIATTHQGKACRPAPGATDHDARIVIVTYGPANEQPNQLLMLNAARWASETLVELLHVAYSPERIDLVVLIHGDPQLWARETLLWRFGKWGARLEQHPDATIVSVDPTDWQWCLRSAERAARLALVRLSRALGTDLHQCVAGDDMLCTCLTTGNFQPNTASAWQGERGALAGRLTDPRSVRGGTAAHGWRYENGINR